MSVQDEERRRIEIEMENTQCDMKHYRSHLDEAVEVLVCSLVDGDPKEDQVGYLKSTLGCLDSLCRAAESLRNLRNEMRPYEHEESRIEELYDMFLTEQLHKN